MPRCLPNTTGFQRFLFFFLVFCSSGISEEDAGVEAHRLRRRPLPSSLAVPCPAHSAAAAACPARRRNPCARPSLAQRQRPSLPFSAWPLRPYQRRALAADRGQELGASPCVSGSLSSLVNLSLSVWDAFYRSCASKNFRTLLDLLDQIVCPIWLCIHWNSFHSCCFTKLEHCHSNSELRQHLRFKLAHEVFLNFFIVLLKYF
jgi:hypothetical protein